VLQNDQVLLAHPTGDGGPPYNFFQGGSKIGLKYSILATKTLEPGE